MLPKLRYSHGYKSFEIKARNRTSGEEATLKGIISLPNLYTEGPLPIAFHYYNESENRRYHYSLDELLSLYTVPPDILAEITVQRKSM